MKNGNKNTIYYIEPKYYKKFACIGGSCQMSCCVGWRVDWTKDEVEKLKNAECSEHLKELVENSFEVKGENNIIKMDNKNSCPFLTDDSLCIIQKELGIDYMSNTCMNYPRRQFSSRHVVLRYCNPSCIQVIDTLMNDVHSMELERRTKIVSEKQEKQLIPLNEELFNRCPELNYFRQLFEFYYDIISNESHSLETSVLWGSYVSMKFKEMIDANQQQFIPEAIRCYREDVNKKELSDKLEAIEPNYDMKLKFAIFLHNMIVETNIFNDIFIDEQHLDIDKFKEGERRFKEAFADRPFALRNIALELLMAFNIPFRDMNLNIFDSYCYFIAAFAVIKLMGPAIYLKNTPTPEIEYKKAIAFINRSFAHNDENIKAIVNLIKNFRCDIPANLAAIIK